MAGGRGPAWAQPGSSDPTLGHGRWVAIVFALLGWGAFGIGETVGGLAFLAVAVWCWLYSRPDIRARIAHLIKSWSDKPAAPLPVTTVAGVRGRALATGAGAYLATGERGEWISAPPQSAVLVLA